MSLYFVFTIDGDWNEYFHSKAPDIERQPDKKTLLGLIRREMDISACTNGRFLHFAHASSVTPDFFFGPEFIDLWKEIIRRGGNVGVHCHHEELFHDGRFTDRQTMERAVGSTTAALVKAGIRPISYRGGYMTLCAESIPILEKEGLLLDFSCDPGRYLYLEGEVVSDWRGAPDTHYRMSYEDHRKPGGSNVVEIPLGKAGGGSLYIETVSLISVWKAARALAKRARDEKRDIIVSVLSHTYEFSSLWKRLIIRSALLICKRYGVFINDEEALEIINREKTQTKG